MVGENGGHLVVKSTKGASCLRVRHGNQSVCTFIDGHTDTRNGKNIPTQEVYPNPTYYGSLDYQTWFWTDNADNVTNTWRGL